MKLVSKLITAIAILQLLGCDAGMDQDQSDLMRTYGYQGSPEIWAQFLQCWTDESLLAYSEAENLTEMERKIVNRESHGFPPATREQIADKEKELDIEFPKSYKHFLLASNGWLQPFLDYGDGLILPIEEVSYFSEIAPEFYSIVTETLNDPSFSSGFSRSEIADNQRNYTENQNPVLFDDRHFIDSIAISEDVDAGIYLINVHKRTPEDEWEIWFYSSNHPGVYRFVSFAHLMQYTYLKTVHSPEYDIPYGESYIDGTCAEALGYPKVK